MKLYKISMIVMLVLAIVVAIFTTLQIYTSDQSNLNFLNTLLGILLFTFCVVQFICLFTRKIKVQNIGFFLLHSGLVLFLIGVFIYKTVGMEINTYMPVNNVTYSSIQRNQGELVDLGFQIGVSDFKVLKYDPVYDLYEKTDDHYKAIIQDVEPNENGIIDFGSHGSIESNVFSNNETQYKLSDNLVVLKREPDKYYEATITVTDPDGSNSKQEKLIVNKPFRRNGWVVYLMSYEPGYEHIAILFKYDPLEWLASLGLWMIIVGTFIMCFSRIGNKKAVKVNE